MIYFLLFQFPSTERSFQEVQSEMNDAAVNLNTAASDIITNSRTTTQQLSHSSEQYNRAYQYFVDTGLTLAGMFCFSFFKSVCLLLIVSVNYQMIREICCQFN